MAKKSLVIITLALLLSGCATKGRLALVDLDLRTPEQIIASIPENTVIYTGTTNNVTIGEPKVATDPWDIVIRLISVIKGRLRILSIEWNEK